MAQQDFILLILNCTKYAYKADLQRATWIPLLPKWLAHYHVIGDPLLPTPFRFDDDAHILVVRTEDDYVSLPKKVVAAFRAVVARFEFKYVFKTDDDQHISPVAIFDVFARTLNDRYFAPNRVLYGGKWVPVEAEHVSQYYKIHPELSDNIIIKPGGYCNGRFYLVSHEAVAHILAQHEQIENECLEDYAIGQALLAIRTSHNVLLFNNDMFCTDNPSGRAITNATDEKEAV